MALTASSRNYQGQLLCYEPGYGWGWSGLDKSGNDARVDYSKVARAGAFHIRVERFFHSNGELRGIVGRIEQPGHMFDGMWAVTYTMQVGKYDLVKNLCVRWDIMLSPVVPSKDDWPHMHGASRRYCGYGILAVSHDAIVQYRSGAAVRRIVRYLIGTWSALFVGLVVGFAYTFVPGDFDDPPWKAVMIVGAIPYAVVMYSLALEMIYVYRWKSLLILLLLVWPFVFLTVICVAPIVFLGFRTYSLLKVLRSETEMA